MNPRLKKRIKKKKIKEKKVSNGIVVKDLLDIYNEFQSRTLAIPMLIGYDSNDEMTVEFS